jgi:hypothetical protein
MPYMIRQRKPQKNTETHRKTPDDAEEAERHGAAGSHQLPAISCDAILAGPLLSPLAADGDN